MVRCVGGAWVVIVAGYGNVRHVVLLIVFCVVDFLISRFALDNAALVNSKINYLYSFRHSWNSKSDFPEHRINLSDILVFTNISVFKIFDGTLL